MESSTRKNILNSKCSYAAERAETRKNSALAREVELALPSLLSPEERQRITEKFATELVERYNVAVSVVSIRKLFANLSCLEQIQCER